MRPPTGPRSEHRQALRTRPRTSGRAPHHPALVDPFCGYLHERRAQDPAVPVLNLLAEIRERGYTGSQSLLYRYITRGRVEADRPALSPRRLTRYPLTRPGRLANQQHELLDTLIAACPQMTALVGLVRSFAALLTPTPGNIDRLTDSTTAAPEGVNTKTNRIMRKMHGRAGFSLLRHRVLRG
ncbi:hypothetical protein QI554_41155 [Yinghuangia seranimata]|nr:hypothetical protein [Yinghuangia seranimata]MDI2132559.1 hypothetical protein [Yinghuangia seranimata]